MAGNIGAQSSGSDFYISNTINVGAGGGGATADANAGAASSSRYLTAAQRDQRLSTAELRAETAKYVAETKRMEAENKKASASTRQMGRSSMMLSISMFVTVLIIRQMTMAMVGLAKAFGLGDEDAKELTKTVNAMNSAIGLLMGPIQLYHMWAMITTGDNVALALSFMSVAAGAAAAFAIYSMLTTESLKLKVVYGALTAVTLSLAAATFYKAYADLAATASNPLTVWMVPLMIAAMVAGAIGISSLNKGETADGSYRTMQRSGPVYLHAGEQVGRITPQQTINNSGSRSITIISNDPYRTARMIERDDRRGLGRNNIKRTVA